MRRSCLAASLLLIAAVAQADPVVTVDLMRTKPGEQHDYLRFVELNWAPARAMARERGQVDSYEVLARPPDGESWDVMLRTTYPDADAYAAREETFVAIFSELGETRRVDGKGPRDMAEFLDDGREGRIVVPAD